MENGPGSDRFRISNPSQCVRYSFIFQRIICPFKLERIQTWYCIQAAGVAAGQPSQLLRPLAGGTTPSPSKPLFFLASILPLPLIPPASFSFLYYSYHKSLFLYFLLFPSLLLISSCLHRSRFLYSSGPHCFCFLTSSLPLPIFPPTFTTPGSFISSWLHSSYFLYSSWPPSLLLPIFFLASIPLASFISSCPHPSCILYSSCPPSFPLPEFLLPPSLLRAVLYCFLLYPSRFLYFLWNPSILHAYYVSSCL